MASAIADVTQTIHSNKTMADLHIHDFYKDSAKALAQLYKQFPKKSCVFVEDLIGPDTPDEFGLHSERHRACFGTLQWLAQAGYCHYDDTIRMEAIDQAVLSHRSFTLLTAIPKHVLLVDHNANNRLATPTSTDSHLQDHSPQAHAPISYIRLIRHALKSGSSSQLESVMQQLFNDARNH